VVDTAQDAGRLKRAFPATKKRSVDVLEKIRKLK
jgi:hypothetical protein